MIRPVVILKDAFATSSDTFKRGTLAPLVVFLITIALIGGIGIVVIIIHLHNVHMARSLLPARMRK